VLAQEKWEEKMIDVLKLGRRAIIWNEKIFALSKS
jgi:hypothetical protein